VGDAADADRGPPVTLQFDSTRRREMRAARGVCRDHGWRIVSSAGAPASSIVVPGEQAVQLLHRLAELEAGPDKVVIRSSDLPRLPVRALHEALPPGTTLTISD
jgi:hypothetical protein